MLVLRPKLHALIEPEEDRNLKQLESFGIDPGERPTGTTVGIRVTPGATAEQQLLAEALADLTLRLDPLVYEVRLEGFTEAWLGSVRGRVPVELADTARSVDLIVSIGPVPGTPDLTVDAAGWVAAVNAEAHAPHGEILNPIGALAAAALATGEIFKIAFARAFPDAPYARRFEPAEGAFSFFDYRYRGANPLLQPMAIDATLVGAGGVGAGAIATIAALRNHVSGVLHIVDDDRLSRDNLNRVTYARVQSALDGELKVVEAAAFLGGLAPHLRVEGHPCRFGAFKRALAPRREHRRYDVIITALDNDDARHEVQRDLPRILIDGATGRDANITVERVLVGQWGCLGCTRQNAGQTTPANCDELPDTRAPSASFLSHLPGVLACGELVKYALGDDGALTGSFSHVFTYPLNEDMALIPAMTPSCRIQCSRPSIQHAYQQKYGPPASSRDRRID